MKSMRRMNVCFRTWAQNDHAAPTLGSPHVCWPSAMIKSGSKYERINGIAPSGLEALLELLAWPIFCAGEGKRATGRTGCPTPTL